MKVARGNAPSSPLHGPCDIPKKGHSLAKPSCSSTMLKVANRSAGTLRNTCLLAFRVTLTACNCVGQRAWYTGNRDLCCISSSLDKPNSNEALFRAYEAASRDEGPVMAHRASPRSFNNSRCDVPASNNSPQASAHLFSA